MSDPADPFRAIADPTRRSILDLLAERGSLTVGELAAAFPNLVASGISKHLMTLRAAGLVRARKDGRNQHYEIDRDGWRDAFAPWVQRYDAYWSGALQRLSEAATDDPQD